MANAVADQRLAAARPRGAALAVVLVLIGALLVPREASAYRTMADDPAVAFPARWQVGPIAWDISTAELDDRLAEDGAIAAAQGAFAAWAATDCAEIDTRFEGTTTTPAAAGDSRSSIAFVTSDWVGRGFPSGRGATTDLQLQRLEDGTVWIVEADIYLNLAAYEFVLENPGPGQLDLQAVLTHEVGHALGLLHVCEQYVTDTAPTCDASTAFQESVLYPTYEGAARALAPDDVLGICALYQDASSCDVTCPVGTECMDGRCLDPACGEPFCTEPCPPEGCGDPMCDADASCAVGACALIGPDRGYCVYPGSIGGVCGQGEDCSSGLCLTSESVGSFCTLDCADDTECGGMLRCEPVDGRRVCVPIPPAGCAVAHGPSDHRRGLPTCLMAIALLALLASRRAPSRTS